MLPEELLGLSTRRQVECQTSIMLEVTLVIGISYYLTPGRLQELPNQLQKFLDSCFTLRSPRYTQEEKLLNMCYDYRGTQQSDSGEPPSSSTN